MSRGKGICISIIEMIVFIFIAIFKGLFIVDKLDILSAMKNSSLLISVAYFVGLAAALTELRFFDLILRSLKRAFCIVSIWSLLEIMAVVLYSSRVGSVSALKTDAPAYGLVFFGAMLVALMVTIWHYNDYFPKGESLLCDDGKIHVYSNLGTVHTPRSVKAATTAVEEDRIPMLGINYGMILVMTVFKIIRTPFIYFMQLLYYGTGNAFVCIFIMGFMMEYWGASFGYAIFSAVVVLFATEEISVRYKLCTDATGLTNWGITQYPDVWMMCCIALSYFRLVFCTLSSEKTFGIILVYTVICAVQWAWLAPQFSVMLAGAMGCNIVLLFLVGAVDKAISLIIIFLTLVIMTLISARIGGGMFQRKDKIRSDIKGSGSKEKFSLAYKGVCLRDIRKMNSDHMECIITTKIRDIVKSWFFVLVVLFSYGTRSFYNFALWDFFIGFNLLVLFIGGFVLIYFVSKGNGAGKMELSRFSTLAFVLSKIAWMGIVYNWVVEGKVILGFVGIIFAVYMIVNSIPFHVRWNEMYSNKEFKGLLPIWFSGDEEINEGVGFYSADSKRSQNIIKRNTTELTNLETLKNKTVYIYGTGEYARKLYYIIKECGSEIKGFIDSNSKMWKQELEGHRVLSPQYVGKIEKSDDVIIIGSNLSAGIYSIYTMCALYSLKNIVLYKVDF